MVSGGGRVEGEEALFQFDPRSSEKRGLAVDLGPVEEVVPEDHYPLARGVLLAALVVVCGQIYVLAVLLLQIRRGIFDVQKESKGV